MELDVKHMVLFAIYTEYQKDLPAMNDITATSLDLPMDVFNVAVDKLQNEGFIKNVDQTMGPWRVSIDRVMITREGVDYVERKLEVQRDRTGKERVQILAEKFAAHGWNILADLAVRAIVEIGKNAS